MSDRETSRASFMSKETRFSGRYASTVFQTLRAAYGRFLGRIALLIVCGFFSRVLLLSNANIIGAWVDTFCRAPQPCRPAPELIVALGSSGVLALLTFVTFAGFGLSVLFRLAFSRLSARAVSHLYDEVTLRTSRLPIRFFDTTPVGAIVTRFSSDYGNVFRLFGGPLAEFGVIIFDLVAMLILITVASPWFLPLCLAIGVLNYGIYRLNRERIREERRELSASRAPAIAHYSETAQGAGTIRVFSKQDSFSKRFRELNGTYVARRLSTFGVLYRFSFQMGLLSALLLLATGIAGLVLVQTGRVSVGSIGVAFTFIALSSGSLQMFFEWMAQFEEAMTGVERLDNYLRRDLEPGLRLPLRASFATGHPQVSQELARRILEGDFARGPAAEVRAENLWFRYSSDGPWILEDVTFTIKPGERVGIVGRTGSGKSSLIQALFRLYPIERGRLSVDGHEPALDASRAPAEREADLERYRRSIALIAQEPTLFRGTVRENLALAQEISDERLLEALGRVGLSHWIVQQPRGLESPIEERGRNLSLGERQLLCMARCLLQDAPVIVMDEATSAVDPQSEEILVRATDEFFRGRTQLIIAHRLSTLESCDRILWLKKGRIHRLGPAAPILRELRESNGLALHE